MTKQRASAYYKVRLRREHPVIYAELGPGKKYKTVRQAAAAAGLIHLPTRLDALKREWKKASSIEQREFVKWLKTGMPGKGRPVPMTPVVDADGHLHPVAAKFIRDWLVGRKNRQLMREMGLSPLDVSVSEAANSNRRLHRPNTIAKIGSWLAKNGVRW